MDYTFNQYVGRKNIIADRLHNLGDTGYVHDASRTGLGPKVDASAMPIRARIVKGNGALTPGTRVKYTSGLFGTEVEAAAAEQAHGLVDPNLVAATAADDTFLIFIEGPMNVIASAAISANAQVQGAASGKVATLTSGVAEGRMVVASTADAQVRRAYMNFPQN